MINNNVDKTINKPKHEIIKNIDSINFKNNEKHKNIINKIDNINNKISHKKIDRPVNFSGINKIKISIKNENPFNKTQNKNMKISNIIKPKNNIINKNILNIPNNKNKIDHINNRISHKNIDRSVNFSGINKLKNSIKNENPFNKTQNKNMKISNIIKPKNNIINKNILNIPNNKNKINHINNKISHKNIDRSVNFSGINKLKIFIKNENPFNKTQNKDIIKTIKNKTYENLTNEIKKISEIFPQSKKDHNFWMQLEKNLQDEITNMSNHNDEFSIYFNLISSNLKSIQDKNNKIKEILSNLIESNFFQLSREPQLYIKNIKDEDLKKDLLKIINNKHQNKNIWEDFIREPISRICALIYVIKTINDNKLSKYKFKVLHDYLLDILHNHGTDINYFSETFNLNTKDLKKNDRKNQLVFLKENKDKELRKNFKTINKHLKRKIKQINNLPKIEDRIHFCCHDIKNMIEDYLIQNDMDSNSQMENILNKFINTYYYYITKNPKEYMKLQTKSTIIKFLNMFNDCDDRLDEKKWEEFILYGLYKMYMCVTIIRETKDTNLCDDLIGILNGEIDDLISFTRCLDNYIEISKNEDLINLNKIIEKEIPTQYNDKNITMVYDDSEGKFNRIYNSIVNSTEDEENKKFWEKLKEDYVIEIEKINKIENYEERIKEYQKKITKLVNSFNDTKKFGSILEKYNGKLFKRFLSNIKNISSHDFIQIFNNPNIYLDSIKNLDIRKKILKIYNLNINKKPWAQFIERALSKIYMCIYIISKTRTYHSPNHTFLIKNLFNTICNKNFLAIPSLLDVRIKYLERTPEIKDFYCFKILKEMTEITKKEVNNTIRISEEKNNINPEIYDTTKIYAKIKSPNSNSGNGNFNHDLYSELKDITNDQLKRNILKEQFKKDIEEKGIKGKTEFDEFKALYYAIVSLLKKHYKYDKDDIFMWDKKILNEDIVNNNIENEEHNENENKNLFNKFNSLYENVKSSLNNFFKSEDSQKEDEKGENKNNRKMEIKIDCESLYNHPKKIFDSNALKEKKIMTKKNRLINVYQMSPKSYKKYIKRSLMLRYILTYLYINSKNWKNRNFEKFNLQEDLKYLSKQNLFKIQNEFDFEIAFLEKIYNAVEELEVPVRNIEHARFLKEMLNLLKDE